MRAGFYRVDITPKEEGRIFTNEYGKNVMLVPHDVGDNMYARILVVDDGENKQVVISTDLCTSNEEDVFCYDTRLGVRKLTSQWPGGTKDYISELTGVSVQNIYLMATHNHLAPTCCQSINIVKELATGVKRAIENLEEVQLSYTETDYNLVKNRRPWSNTLNTELPHDTKVRILLFYNKSGKMIGAIINYACHGTILRYGPYPHKISGEFIGIGMSKIEEKMGNGFVSMFMQGASGDNGPVIDKDYSFVVHCGRRLANIVLDALEKNTLDFSNNKEILTVDKVVSVKKAIYPATNENARNHLKIESRELNIGCIKFGEIAIVCISGELFNAIGKRIMDNSPYKYTFISSLVDGHSGYLPSYSAFHDGIGGYELCVTPYTDSLEEDIFKNVMELLKR